MNRRSLEKDWFKNEEEDRREEQIVHSHLRKKKTQNGTDFDTGKSISTHVSTARASRQLHLDDAENDNYWSTSLYSEPPLLTSSRCVRALRDFFANPSLLAVATESSSHPTGLQSVLSQPWLYAGGGLGNIPECPLQVCLAGAGTRRDSITFASVCVPYECHAQDLAATDFPASLELAAQPVFQLKSNPDDDDDPFEYFDHPERNHDNQNNNTDNKIWWHSSPGQQREFTQEYITLHTRIAKLNDFLQTGWTCGNYHVPFQAFPFGVPYLVICGGLLLLTLLGTYGYHGRSSSSNSSKRSQNKSSSSKRKTITPQQTTKVFIETDQNDETQGLLLQHQYSKLSTMGSKSVSGTFPTQDTQSIASLSSNASDLPRSPESDQDIASSTASSPQQSHKSCDTNTNNRKPDTPDTEDGDSIFVAWNASKHWQTLCTSRHEATACLDGLRVWSILWVILGHVMAIQSSTGGGYSNPVDFLPPSGLTTTFLGQLIFASRFAVDTFLVISGYLLVVVLVRKAPTFLQQDESQDSLSNSSNGVSQRRKIVTFFQLIGLRLLRILPLYLMCMGFFTQVAPHLYLVGEDNEGGGPFWYQWDSLLQPCRDYGWTNLLFINNFLPWEKSNTETCFYHSWYLAVDMQLFVLFGLPVTFFIFLRNPTWGRRITLGLWGTSVLLTAYLAYVRHWSINTFDGLSVALFDVEGYAKPHVRGQAYFAGMYVAMLQLTKRRNQTTEIRPTTWKHRALLWGSIFALGFVTFCTVTGAYARRPCQYSEWPMKDDCGSLWSPMTTFLYTASSRAIWSCSIAILMTLCLEGNGGWLNQFLSWPIWSPLAQLSFGTYLIHPIVIFVWLLGMRQKNVYSLATFGMSLTSVCCVSFLFALVAALLVEFPLATLISNKIRKRRIQEDSFRGGRNIKSFSSTNDFCSTPKSCNEETTELICPVASVTARNYGAA